MLRRAEGLEQDVLGSAWSARRRRRRFFDDCSHQFFQQKGAASEWRMFALGDPNASCSIVQKAKSFLNGLQRKGTILGYFGDTWYILLFKGFLEVH